MRAPVMPWSPLDALIDALPEVRKAGRVKPGDDVLTVQQRIADVYLPIVERIKNTAINQAVDACLDMADRYDADIEGCDGEELVRFGEAIACCFRLAYVIKYRNFPPIGGDGWSQEFVERMKEIRRRNGN